MAAFNKNFLDEDGLKALWLKLKSILPFRSTRGTGGTDGWVKVVDLTCARQMNKPLVFHLICRGYSTSTVEVTFLSQTDGTTPDVHYFIHAIKSYDGTKGANSNVGYTYEDIDGVRHYYFWKKKNEGYGTINIHVDCQPDWTNLISFPNEQSNTEPAGIVYATQIWDTVPMKTAVEASAKQVGYDKYGQVVLGNALTKSDVGLGNVDNTSDANKPISTATQTALDGKVAKAGDTMTGQLVNSTANALSILASHGTANKDASVGARRTDTGVGVFVGVGGGGENHGVYSEKNSNWIIKSNNSGAVTINDGKASNKVAIGNSNLGSSTKPIYLAAGVPTEGSAYSGGTAVTLNGTSKAASTASFYAPTSAGTNRRILTASGTGAPTWLIPGIHYAFNSATWNDEGNTKTLWMFRLKGVTASSYSNVLLSVDTYFWNNQKSSSDLIYLGWSNNSGQGLRVAAGRTRIYGTDNSATPLKFYYVKNESETVTDCTVDIYAKPSLNGNSYGPFYVAVLNSGNNDLDDIIEVKDIKNAVLPEDAVEINFTGVTGSTNKLSTARELAVSLSNTSTTTTFDGSANVTNIKVSGTLPIGNGGTGQTTATNIVNETIQSGMGTGNAVITDNTDLVTSHANGYSTTDKGLYRRKAGLYLWPWIKSKLSSDTGVNISGNAATASAAQTGSTLESDISGKADKATGLTGATKTKITYNSQGIVTAGANLDASDIPDLSASKITSGTLPVARGGTGASTEADARTNLSVYSKSEVDSMLGGRVEVVTELPASGTSGVTYYVGPTGTGGDQYDEYIWTNNAFLKVGEHSLDLSEYVNTVTTSGSGSVVTGVSKSGNTVTVAKGNIAIDDLSDWATETDVTIDSQSYHTWWPVAPTSSNQVFGLSMRNGTLYRIYNNKGTYTAQSYAQDTKYTNLSLGQGYGTCATGQSTAAKVVTLADYVLAAGGIVAVKFTNGLCAAATLNVNGKGAKSIYIKGAAVTAENAGTVGAGDLAYFMYDGTVYHLLSTDRAATNPIVNITRNNLTFTATRLDGSTFTFTQQDSDTTYTQEKLGQGYGTCSTAESTAAKTVTLTDYQLVKNGVVAVKFSYGLCAAATMNINSKGAKDIYINGAAVTSTSCKEVLAGDLAFFMYDGTRYQFICTDRVSKDGIVGLSISGKKITYTRADGTTGELNTQDTTYVFDGTYNASTNKAATVSTVTNAINALDVSDISGFGTGKTLATLTETNGKIAATFQNISITKSQVSDFSHTHGNIQNGGTLQTNDITIANGDKLVVTDASDSGKVARTSISFDGSTATKALTQKGTWETFNNYSHPAGSAASKTGVPTGNVSPAFGGTFKVNQISTDSTSHVSAITERTITIPNSTATTTDAGLMSAADKTKLDNADNSKIIDNVKVLFVTKGITARWYDNQTIQLYTGYGNYCGYDLTIGVRQYSATTEAPLTNLTVTIERESSYKLTTTPYYKVDGDNIIIAIVFYTKARYRVTSPIEDMFSRISTSDTWDDTGWTAIPAANVYNRHHVWQSGNSDIGGVNAPVYTTSTGEVKACTTYANATVGTAKKPEGFHSKRDASQMTWGILSGVSYTQVTDWHTTGGGDIAFAEKDGKVSVQIDGYFYQNEGGYRVLDTHDVTSTYSSTGTSPVNGTAVASAISGKQDTLPTTGTPSTTYAINISGKAAQVRSIEFKSPENDKCWGIIAETETINKTDYSITFNVQCDGYSVKSANLGTLSVALAQNSSGVNTRNAVYFYRDDAIEFDKIQAVVVNTGTKLELWVCNKQATQYIYFTPLNTVRFNPIYNKDRQYTQAEFETYLEGKTSFNSVEKGINRSGSDAVGSSSSPVWVDANGTVTACVPQDTANALLNALDGGSSVPVDADFFISQYAQGGTSHTTYHRRPVSKLWEYIKGKLTSVSGVNISGNAATADKPGVTLLDNTKDLNNYKGSSQGDSLLYRWASWSVPSNAPESAAPAVMQVINKLNTNYVEQFVYVAAMDGVYQRACNNGTWTSWRKVLFSSDVTSTYSSSGTAPVNGTAVASAISSKSDTSHTHSVKINGTTKTIAATVGTAVDLGTYTEFAHVSDTAVIGNNSPAADCKTYFVNNVSNGSCKVVYCKNGNEYTIIFAKQSSGNYGNIIKYGYADKYIYILRYKNSAWQSEDWEKISAGYADSAASATNSTNSAVTADTNHQLYLIGATGSSGQQALKTDTGIYATTTSGELNATQYKVNEHCTMKYNSTTNALDFVFS